MPVIIKDLTDDEATVGRFQHSTRRAADQRKAFAYKMKYEALKRQGSI